MTRHMIIALTTLLIAPAASAQTWNLQVAVIQTLSLGSPCTSGALGDQDADNRDCDSGLVCTPNARPGSAFATCEYPMGHGSRCTAATPCDEGEGDCDSDNDCSGSLVCKDDMGSSYGFAAWVDTCEPPLGAWNYCSVTTPCQRGEGDADSVAECAAGLVYQEDTGDRYGFDSKVDTCELPMGHWSRCTPETPCDVGEGDCDNDDDCLGDNVCRHDLGDIYGFSANLDVCAPPVLRCPEDYFSPAQRAAAPQTRFRFPVDNTEHYGVPAIVPEPGVMHYDHGDSIPGIGTSYDGTLTSYDGHTGTDYMLTGGFLGMTLYDTWAVAAADGVVFSVDDTHYDRCHFDLLQMGVVCNEIFEDERSIINNTVTVCHADGVKTSYDHIMQGSAVVSPGDAVSCGEDLAVLASAGRSAAPHLHFTSYTGTIDTFDPYSTNPNQSWWVQQFDILNYGLPGEVCQ